MKQYEVSLTYWQWAEVAVSLRQYAWQLGDTPRAALLRQLADQFDSEIEVA